MRNWLKQVGARTSLAAALVLLIMSVLVLAPWQATAQVPSLNGPYNIDLGKVVAATNLAGTNASTGATATSPTGSAYTITPVNYVNKGIVCSLTTTATSGSPSLSWKIQQYDAASASYFTLLSENVGTGSGPLASQQVMELGPGIAVSGLPSNMFALNVAVPRIWQVSVTAYGNGLTWTGYIGCNMLVGG